ncbi:hypothetical protein JOD82_001807 [Paenibacillus sp. 1182]|uniref:hypothetical protein n=1 Tax=Paenibacillus sp. 1182 TaxID=2806565 RepID=UPI001AE68A9A|nr:hypothetical protein [Paenibacillus sp. 1182]MBP1308787.1 hypothetical protein [Paenibacillus sp. 1182]
MQIKLSQAVTLQSIIKKRLSELKQERDQLAYLFVAKGDQPDTPEDRTFDQVNIEIEATQMDLLEIESKIAKANSTFGVEWDGRHMTIGEALRLAKLFREQAREYGDYGSQRDNDIDRSRMLTTPVLKVLTYRPKDYAEKAQKLTRKANKISDLIDEANLQNMILYPRYSVYMD